MKVKSVKVILLLMVILLELNACGPTPMEVKLGEICKEELEFQRIVVEGKLVVPNDISEDDIFHYYMYLENEDGSIQQQISISTQSSDSDGNEKNKVRPVSSGYDINAVEIVDNNGEIIKNGTQVKLWGNVTDLDGETCTIQSSRIEKL